MAAHSGVAQHLSAASRPPLPLWGAARLRNGNATASTSGRPAPGYAAAPAAARRGHTARSCSGRRAAPAPPGRRRLVTRAVAAPPEAALEKGGPGATYGNGSVAKVRGAAAEGALGRACHLPWTRPSSSARAPRLCGTLGRRSARRSRQLNLPGQAARRPPGPFSARARLSSWAAPPPPRPPAGPRPKHPELLHHRVSCSSAPCKSQQRTISVAAAHPRVGSVAPWPPPCPRPGPPGPSHPHPLGLPQPPPPPPLMQPH
jgi:hypothetical protein